MCPGSPVKLILHSAVITALACLLANPTASLGQNSNTVSRAVFIGAQEHLRRGIAHLDAQRWNAARSEFSSAIDLNPTNALAFDYRGCSYFAEGAADEAIRDFSRVIELEPQNYRGYMGRGNAYRAKHSFALALADLGRSIGLNPSNSAALNSRAAVFNAMDDFTNVVRDCSSSLRLNPQDAKVLVMRGHAYWQNADYKAALNDFRSAIQTDPANPEAFNQLAWIRSTCPEASLRDGPAAVSAALRACELTGWQNASNIDTLAAAYAESGDFQKAIRFQNRAIELSGESVLGMKERLLDYMHARPYRDRTSK